MAAQTHTEAQFVSWYELESQLIAIVGLVVLGELYEFALWVPADVHCVALAERPVIHEGVQVRGAVVPAVAIVRDHVRPMPDRASIEVVVVGVHDLLMADTHGDPGSQPHNLDTHCLASKRFLIPL